MASHSAINLNAFRGAYPAFSNVMTFPDLMVEAYYQNAGFYINQNDSLCGGLSGPIVDFALQLLTCHLLQSSVMIAAGQTNVVVTASSVADVSVSLMPPPAKTGWEFWLASTPYGLQLWSMLTVQAAGGWSVSVAAYPETMALRKAGGSY